MTKNNSFLLKDIFTTLVVKYCSDVVLAEKLWKEIETVYTGKKRFYHNLAHLLNMYIELENHANLISDPDTTLFSIFYHDIIYKATGKDNEEKSAAKAAEVLTTIGFPEIKTDLCLQQILATKSHTASSNADTNFLIDADMAILGYPWQDYEIYYKAVRREYAIYPDFLYNPGRKKVLQHFLAMDAIFKTPIFKDKYEVTARENIAKELALLI